MLKSSTIKMIACHYASEYELIIIHENFIGRTAISLSFSPLIESMHFKKANKSTTIFYTLMSTFEWNLQISRKLREIINKTRWHMNAAKNWTRGWNEFLISNCGFFSLSLGNVCGFSLLWINNTICLILRRGRKSRKTNFYVKLLFYH